MRHYSEKIAIMALLAGSLIIGCAPSLKSGNYKERLLAVSTLGDQEMLAQIALTDYNHEVRSAAVGKLTDPELLTTVAKESEDPQIGKTALDKLTDQNLFARVAIRSRNQTANAAVEKLTDPELLAMVARRSPRGDISVYAAEKSGDQRVLAEIVLNYTNYSALSKLTDQGLLAKIVVESKDWDIRKTAVEKLADPVALREIAETGVDREVRAVARKRYRDTLVAQCNGKWDDLQRLLPGETIHIISTITAEYDISEIKASAREIMSAVLGSLGYKVSPANDTPSVIEFMVELTPVAKKYYAPGMRSGTDFYTAARADGVLVIRMGDRCLGAKNIEYATTPASVISKSTEVTSPATDSKYFYSIFHTWFDKMVADFLEFIQPSQAQLGEMAKNGMNWTSSIGSVAYVVFDKLSDQKVLTDVAHNAEDGGVRVRALEKLSNEILIAQAATSDKDPFVRRRAVDMLTDRQLLVNILRGKEKEKDISVRNAAERRLEDLKKMERQ